MVSVYNKVTLGKCTTLCLNVLNDIHSIKPKQKIKKEWIIQTALLIYFQNEIDKPTGDTILNMQLSIILGKRNNA